MFFVYRFFLLPIYGLFVGADADGYEREEGCEPFCGQCGRSDFAMVEPRVLVAAMELYTF